VKPSPSLAAQERLARLEKARRAAGRHPEAIGHGDPVFNSPSAIANRIANRAKGKDLLHPPRNLRSWYRDAVGAATGEGTAGATFRHMAGRAPGQRIGIGGTLKALASPRYPGLHAPAGTLASARTLGRSRQALGNALRLGSAAATAGSTAAVAEHLYQGLPRGLAGAALTDSHPGDLAETRYAKQLRGLYPHYLKQLTGISKPKSQYDKTVTDAITRTIVPQARYNMHTARKSHPKAWGAIDALRSASPLGALFTAAARLGGTSERPDYENLMARPIAKSMATPGHDPGASPYHGPIMRGVAGHAAWRARSDLARPAANEIQKAMQTPAGRLVTPSWAKKLVTKLPKQWKRMEIDPPLVSPATRRKTEPQVQDMVGQSWRDGALDPGDEFRRRLINHIYSTEPAWTRMPGESVDYPGFAEWINQVREWVAWHEDASTANTDSLQAVMQRDKRLASRLSDR
jgi:hypothetical protein